MDTRLESQSWGVIKVKNYYVPGEIRNLDMGGNIGMV